MFAKQITLQDIIINQKALPDLQAKEVLDKFHIPQNDIVNELSNLNKEHCECFACKNKLTELPYLRPDWREIKRAWWPAFAESDLGAVNVKPRSRTVTVNFYGEHGQRGHFAAATPPVPKEGLTRLETLSWEFVKYQIESKSTKGYYTDSNGKEFHLLKFELINLFLISYAPRVVFEVPKGGWKKAILADTAIVINIHGKDHIIYMWDYTAEEAKYLQPIYEKFNRRG
jgi:hypothetical protein